MTLTALWILLTAPGFGCALLSIFRGRSFVRDTLKPQHPELVASWRVEAVRDVLIAAIIGCLAVIGLASAVGLQIGSGARLAVGVSATVGLFLAVLLLDLLAFLNYWLRWGRR